MQYLDPEPGGFIHRFEYHEPAIGCANLRRHGLKSETVLLAGGSLQGDQGEDENLGGCRGAAAADNQTIAKTCSFRPAPLSQSLPSLRSGGLLA